MVKKWPASNLRNELLLKKGGRLRRVAASTAWNTVYSLGLTIFNLMTFQMPKKSNETF